jgi:hypothetical protein
MFDRQCENPILRGGGVSPCGEQVWRLAVVMFDSKPRTFRWCTRCRRAYEDHFGSQELLRERDRLDKEAEANIEAFDKPRTPKYVKLNPGDEVEVLVTHWSAPST